MKFYVSASLKDAPTVAVLYEKMIEMGHEVTHDWTTYPHMDAWSTEERREMAATEIDGVVGADCVIFLLPGGRGAHVEVGAALGVGIPVLLCGEEDKNSLFYCHPFVSRCISEEPK